MPQLGNPKPFVKQGTFPTSARVRDLVRGLLPLGSLSHDTDVSLMLVACVENKKVRLCWCIFNTWERNSVHRYSTFCSEYIQSGMSGEATALCPIRKFWSMIDCICDSGPIRL